jgi:hypothetical protein
MNQTPAEQSVHLPGKKLYKDNQMRATITEQLTPLHFCDQHAGCPGPVCRVTWSDGRVRRECLYTLIKGQDYELRQ